MSKVDTIHPIDTLEGHTHYVASVAFSPDGTQIVSGSWDNTVRLWNVQSREQIATLEGHYGGVRSVAFSPDGNYIVSGSRDNTVRLWNVQSRDQIATLKGPTDEMPKSLISFFVIAMYLTAAN